jgi:aminopeptidase N
MRGLGLDLGEACSRGAVRIGSSSEEEARADGRHRLPPYTPSVRIYRKDYRPSDFLVEDISLHFALDPERTLVRATTTFIRNAESAAPDAPLELQGDELELVSVALNGEILLPSRYDASPNHLRIDGVPDRFELQTEVALAPAGNTQLMGLYTSNGVFCTQCEAEGFRRISYALDRPDVMARYTTRIEADRERYPVLLSNGNRIAEGELPDGRHFVEWEDPFRKPSYLFALVAGDLRCHRGSFTTASGRDVALEIWVEPDNIDRCEHALRSLQAAMKWDEETYGLEYDLDIYMIVAVNDFNMGAMENKGLNVFNSKFVLAKPSTATDDDYEGIESVVAHEYFHNWTGNRVTCRDWFQLTLKEGLTVFRDQEFSADMTSPAVKRIQDVTRLRTAQFVEDAGPAAHPIRPESYIEMNNFYTATVYEKGAEVVRLYQAQLGKEGFRRGLRHYLSKHDGQAVTCDDFRAAMGEANGVDFSSMERWYSQAGTPTVRASGAYEADARRYALTLSQSQPSIDGASEPLPLPIPVRVALIGEAGAELPGTERTLELREREQTFTFEDVDEPPVLSLGRGFSAPVRFEVERSLDELAFLLAHDTDAFNRWEAGQELGKRTLLALVSDLRSGRELSIEPKLVDAFAKVIDDETLDGSIKSLMLSLPSEIVLAQEGEEVDPGAIHQARQFAVQALGRSLEAHWRDTYRRHMEGADDISKTEIDRRRIKNRALRYLLALEQPDSSALAARQFDSATTMTDYEAAFTALVDIESAETRGAIEAFYARWKADPLVLDKWFRIQAMSTAPGAFERVLALAAHPDFTLQNPNRARSLLYAFAAGNPSGFHREDGRGYRFVADHVIALDATNPQVAARIASAFNAWKRYEPRRGAMMHEQLERIAEQPGLSKNVSEIVQRALGH